MGRRCLLAPRAEHEHPGDQETERHKAQEKPKPKGATRRILPPAAQDGSASRLRRKWCTMLHRLMFVTALLAATVTAPSVASMPYGSACGVFRWAVKTARDPGAVRLPSSATATSIATLVRLSLPGDPAFFTARRSPVETTLWHVRARLQGYVQEPDGDMHLLLRDPHTGEAMIGEIPAPYCSPPNHAAQYAAARGAVERIGRHAARPHRIWWLDYRGATPPLIDAYGYGFWDDEHHQTGAARNGVELHPILRIVRD
jgi:hypothetical protein